MNKRYLTPAQIYYSLANLRQITFEVTDACNLKCKYCGYGEFYDDYDRRSNKMMPFTMAKQVIDYLVPFWQSPANMSADKNVYISFYGGEPLMNMELIQQVVHYMEGLHLENRHYTFSMTTNAMLLDKCMDYLVEKKFNLLLSLDGDEHNDSYRVDQQGKPSFDRVTRNLNLLRDRYPDYFKKKVNFNAVLHNRNSVAEIHRFFKSQYNKIPSIGELNNMGIRPDKVDLFNKTYRNQKESLMQAENYEEIDRDRFIKSPTYQSVCTYLHQYSGFVYRDYNELLYGKPESSNWITGTCPPFSQRMFVTVNGKFLPCERIGQQFALGTVDENGVHLDLEAVAERYNNYFAKIDTRCGTCAIRKSCGQCIFNLKDIESNPVCNGYATPDDMRRYVEAQTDFIRRHPKDYYKIMEEIIVE